MALQVQDCPEREAFVRAVLFFLKKKKSCAVKPKAMVPSSGHRAHSCTRRVFWFPLGPCLACEVTWPPVKVVDNGKGQKQQAEILEAFP